MAVEAVERLGLGEQESARALAWAAREALEDERKLWSFTGQNLVPWMIDVSIVQRLTPAGRWRNCRPQASGMAFSSPLRTRCGIACRI